MNFLDAILSTVSSESNDDPPPQKKSGNNHFKIRFPFLLNKLSQTDPRFIFNGYNEHIFQFFVDFSKAFDSVHKTKMGILLTYHINVQSVCLL